MLNNLANDSNAGAPSSNRVSGEPQASGSRKLRVIERGASLFQEDASQPEIVRIVDGCLCVFSWLSNERRQIIDILGPGRLVDEHLFNQKRCNVIALTRTRLRSVDLVDEEPSTVKALQQMWWRAQSHVTLLGRKTMTEKVAVALLDLAGQFGLPSKKRSGGDITFQLHLTRADLADWLGLTLSTVSRCLNAFKHHGLITFDDPKLITIRNRDTLEALASGICVSAYRSPHRSGRIRRSHTSDPVIPTASSQEN